MTTTIFESDVAARVETHLAASEFDALLTVSAGGSRYLSGAPLPFQLFYPARPTAVLWPRDGEPVLFTGDDQISGVQAFSWIREYRGYREEGRPTASVLAELLATELDAHGLAQATIGVERLLIPAVVADAIHAVCPQLRFAAADRFLDLLRATKTPSEIERMRRMGRACELGTRQAFEEARAGWTERQLGNAIARGMGEHGADTVPMMLVGAGPGARMFGAPSDRVLEPGMIVRIDLNGQLEGYYGDLGRMAVVGSPNAAQEAIYAAHVEMNDRLLPLMKPGVLCSEMFAYEEEIAAELGVELLAQPSTGLGHAIGTMPNDSPELMASDDTPLEAGMIFMIEPDMFGPEGERVHLEEMVLVTAQGGELLTGHSDWTTLPRIALP